MINHKESLPADSIIFDLDGTLWDASNTCAKAWNAALHQTGYGHHVVTEDFVRSVSGLKIENIFNQHFQFIPEEKHGDLLDAYIKHEIILMEKWGGALYPLVKETLLKLSEQYKLFIVSNCLPGYIENFINFHQFQNIFIDFESAGNTGLPKSENIKMLVKRNQLKQPVYVGDTVWDYEASLNNHLTFIFASYGFGTVNESRWKIEAFSELPHILGLNR